MLPTLFIGHGGGPLPLLRHPTHNELLATWRTNSLLWSTLNGSAIEAVVVVSAHHETTDRSVRVMTDAAPSLLYDYGGFPPEAYTYKMPNPGSPDLAKTILDLLEQAGIDAEGESGRGHDHGVFVPLLGLGFDRSRPDVPVISVSMRGPATYREGLAADHFALGQALRPLRQRGVLVVGSGNTLHGRCSAADSLAFDEHLHALARRGPSAFEAWADHPIASVVHRRPEHLVPLLVCAGAAPDAKVRPVRHRMMDMTCSHFLFEG